MISFKQIGILLLTLVFFLGGFFYGHYKGKLEHAPQKSAANSTKVVGLKAEIVRLEGVVEHLAGELESAENRLAKQRGLIAQKKRELERFARVEKSPLQVAENEQESAYPDMEQKVKDRVANLVAKYKDNPNYNGTKAAAEAFKNETVDDDWSYEHKEKLNELFATEGALQGAVLKSMECRSKHCRVQVYYQSKDEVSELTQDLTSVFLNDNSKSFIPSIMVNYSDKGKVADIFLTDDPDASLH